MRPPLSQLVALTVLASALAAGTAQAACYTVYDGRGIVISQTSTPPVDMSEQLHETVPQRFGAGAQLIFDVMEPPCGPPAEPFAASPLTARQVVRAPKPDRG